MKKFELVGVKDLVGDLDFVGVLDFDGDNDFVGDLDLDGVAVGKQFKLNASSNCNLSPFSS